jgi:hypothetical protein
MTYSGRVVNHKDAKWMGTHQHPSGNTIRLATFTGRGWGPEFLSTPGGEGTSERALEVVSKPPLKPKLGVGLQI